MAAFDVLCSASRGEGFPNVVGEAMACGVPCVVTDVGDSAMIVGDTGRVVPPENAEALAKGLMELLQLSPSDRAALGKAARERIRSEFDIAVIADRYAALYEELSGSVRLW